MKKQKFTVDNRINGQIKASQVRITGEGIESKIVSLGDALALAGDMSLDLVEISPNANPPVCRICDFGKFLYEKKIQDKLNKKNRLRPKQVSDISLKDIETLISSGKLTDADLRVLEAQLNKLEKAMSQNRLI